MTPDTDTDALKVRVGARLRALRRARDLSQRDVASLLNTDAAEVSRHESGARCPSVPLLARYAEVLEVPIYELLRFDEPELDPRLSTSPTHARPPPGSTPGGAAPQAVIAPIADDEGGSTVLSHRRTPPKAYFHVSGVRRIET
jgi:transcriptional regulator with XRE-family HTH domain